MSVSRQSASSYECSHDDCSEQFTEPTAFQGSYCSQDCADRDRGSALLSALRWDHRFCGSCYRPRKVVYRPSEGEAPRLRKKGLIIRESFVGFEDLTEYADHGPYGVECTCGTVGHADTEVLFRDGAPYEWFLKRAVEQLRNEGKFDHQFDIPTFVDEFWNGADFELAVGRALTEE